MIGGFIIMKSLFGRLLLLLTVMVSAMVMYANIGNMLFDAPVSAFNRIASAVYLLTWIAMMAYSLLNSGEFSVFLSLYWFASLTGAALCVITIAGVTRAFELAAYLLLFILTPLFGLRRAGLSNLMWALIMAGVSACFATAALIASYKRPAEADSEDGGENDPAARELEVAEPEATEAEVVETETPEHEAPEYESREPEAREPGAAETDEDATDDAISARESDYTGETSEVAWAYEAVEVDAETEPTEMAEPAEVAETSGAAEMAEAAEAPAKYRLGARVRKYKPKH